MHQFNIHVNKLDRNLENSVMPGLHFQFIAP